MFDYLTDGYNFRQQIVIPCFNHCMCISCFILFSKNYLYRLTFSNRRVCLMLPLLLLTLALPSMADPKPKPKPRMLHLY